MKMKQTAEQIAFCEAFVNPKDNSSIVLSAVAGSGKTTTILAPVNHPNLASKRIAYIAFNKTIAKELEAKLLKNGVPSNRAQAGTCHSFGYKTFIRGNGKPQVDGQKIYQVTEDYFNQNSELPWVMKAMVRKLVSLGKQAGAGMAFEFNDMNAWLDMIYHYDVNDSDAITDEEIAKHAIAVLRRSNQIKNKIDFDDMIYLPLLQNLKFDQFDFVVIDEAQDTNWSRREMAGRMLAEGGRLMAVGDDRQAIYGFTGAGADSLDQIVKNFNAKQMPLTYCFRSGKKIVEYAQQWNPVIQPAPKAIEGSVDFIDYDAFIQEKDKLNHEMVMLCRNTKPLVKTAFRLIREGVAVYVEGRDIGEGLKKLAQRWKVKKIDVLVDRLKAFRDREIAKAAQKEDEARQQFVDDQYETMLVIIERCRSQKRFLVEDVVAEINILFRDTEEGQRPKCFTLSTIHKSKGREWETVYWLDRPGTLPSKYAKKPWQLVQESNLCYVAATRAKQRLVEVSAAL